VSAIPDAVIEAALKAHDEALWHLREPMYNLRRRAMRSAIEAAYASIPDPQPDDSLEARIAHLEREIDAEPRWGAAVAAMWEELEELKCKRESRQKPLVNHLPLRADARTERVVSDTVSEFRRWQKAVLAEVEKIRDGLGAGGAGSGMHAEIELGGIICDALADRIDSIPDPQLEPSPESEIDRISNAAWRMASRAGLTFEVDQDKLENFPQTDLRSCTCPKDEAPVPCQRRFALGDCLAAQTSSSLAEQINQLAKVLLEEFGGPTQSEGAVEMAIRVLREQKSALRFDQDRIARALYDIRSSHSHELLHREPDWNGEDAEAWHEAELLIKFLDADPQPDSEPNLWSVKAEVAHVRALTERCRPRTRGQVSGELTERFRIAAWLRAVDHDQWSLDRAASAIERGEHEGESHAPEPAEGGDANENTVRELAKQICRLLEILDYRLMEREGPCSGNPLALISPEELTSLYEHVSAIRDILGLEHKDEKK
jgi:hypothetical protein